MKILQIIETAYRATIEEQDDTIIWLTHAIQGAGGDLNVLLRGNAVNYTIEGQDASGLRFGNWQQTQPPRIDRDIAGLIGKGISVCVVEEGLAERGMMTAELVAGVQRMPRAGLAALLDAYDQVWHW